MPWDAAHIEGHPSLAWMAVNSSKPQRARVPQCFMALRDFKDAVYAFLELDTLFLECRLCCGQWFSPSNRGMSKQYPLTVRQL